MAYKFDGVTSNLLLSGLWITATPFTLACFFQSPDISNGQRLMAVKASATNNGWAMTAAGNVGSDPITAAVFDSSTSPTGVASSLIGAAGGYHAGVWSHACSVFTSPTSRTCYKDGIAGTTDITNVFPQPIAVLDRISIGCTVNSGDAKASFLNGQMAHCAAWNVALTASEARQLAEGRLPTEIRPESLVFYLPLDAAAFDATGRTVFVNTNTSPVGELNSYMQPDFDVSLSEIVGLGGGIVIPPDPATKGYGFRKYGAGPYGMNPAVLPLRTNPHLAASLTLGL